MKFAFTFIVTIYILQNTFSFFYFLNLVFEADVLLDSLVKLASVLKSLAEI